MERDTDNLDLHYFCVKARNESIDELIDDYIDTIVDIIRGRNNIKDNLRDLLFMFHEEIYNQCSDDLIFETIERSINMLNSKHITHE
jgi:hypothetical protein